LNDAKQMRCRKTIGFSHLSVWSHHFETYDFFVHFTSFKEKFRLKISPITFWNSAFSKYLYHINDRKIPLVIIPNFTYLFLFK
jgi:hypothetical protein